MTIKSRSSVSLVAGLVLAFGASAEARADEGPPSASAAPAPAPGVASRQTPVHFGLVPFGAERELDVRGLSFSLIADRVGRFEGVQLSPGANLTLEDSRGVQISGGANLAGGGVRGVQIAGGFNLTEREMRGVQVAGGANVARNAFGLQLGVANVAREIEGTQLGVANVAGEARGLQLGVVNVASRGRGFTFGVINVAREHDGEAFGLINIIGNGIHDVAVYSTESMFMNASVKLGGRHLYTSWTFAYSPGDKPAGDLAALTLNRDHRRIGVGFGVGYRFDLDRGRLQFIEVEGSGITVQSKLDFTDGDVPLLTSGRVIFGIGLTREVTLIAGVTHNVAIATGGRDLDLQVGGIESVTRSGKTTVRQYPGLLLGLQL
jgi:hypothetical protein